jgi:predicted DNA-binding transcriptional regulator AlpA
MKMLSTRQVARRLGIDPMTLSRYIAAKKVPTPRTIQLGGMRVHGWREQDVEKLREILPKIANGRKTRYQKKGEKHTTRKPKR